MIQHLDFKLQLLLYSKRNYSPINRNTVQKLKHLNNDLLSTPRNNFSVNEHADEDLIVSFYLYGLPPTSYMCYTLLVATVVTFLWSYIY